VREWRREEEVKGRLFNFGLIFCFSFFEKSASFSSSFLFSPSSSLLYPSLSFFLLSVFYSQ